MLSVGFRYYANLLIIDLKLAEKGGTHRTAHTPHGPITFWTKSMVTPPQFFNIGVSSFRARTDLHLFQSLCFLEDTTANVLRR